MSTPTLAPLQRHAAYSTRQASTYLGISADTVRDLAQTGQFGAGGAWQIRTTGGRVHAIRIAGWAIEAYIERNAL